MIYRCVFLIAAVIALAACGSGKQRLPEVPADVAQEFKADPEAARLLQILQVNRTAAFGEASELAKGGNCRSAIPALRCLARDGQGAAPAQFLLGDCLSKDDRTVERGLSWIRRAADGGYLDAQRRLFEAYRVGSGVAPDKVEALKWLILSETNQVALSLGQSVDIDFVTKRDFDRSLTEQERLAGRDGARAWQRQYWRPAADEKAPTSCRFGGTSDR